MFDSSYQVQLLHTDKCRIRESWGWGQNWLLFYSNCFAINWNALVVKYKQHKLWLFPKNTADILALMSILTQALSIYFIYFSGLMWSILKCIFLDLSPLFCYVDIDS